MAPIIHTQNLTNTRRFHKLWRVLYKNFVSLPRNTPETVMSQIFENTEEYIKRFEERNKEKVRRRFKQGTWGRRKKPEEIVEKREEDYVKTLKKIPMNFRMLFSLTGKHCKCHN